MAKKKAGNSGKSLEKREVKRIGVLSLSKVMGLFGVIYGLIAAVLLVIVMQMARRIPQGAEQIAREFGMISQVGPSVLILFPILYGVMFFITGAIVALIYNLIAKQLGGIELNLN